MIPPPTVLLLAALFLISPVSPARADAPSVLVRTGTHEGYGRVVFDLPSRTEYRVAREGDRVTIQFDGELMIGVPRANPRNVFSVTGGISQAELMVASGTVVRDWRAGDRVVIDVWDRDTSGDTTAPPRQAAARPPPPKPAAAPPPQTTPVPAVAPPAEESAPAPSPAAEAPSTPSKETAAAPPQPEVPTPSAEQPPQPAAAQSTAPELPPAATPQSPPAVAEPQEKATVSMDSVLVLPADRQLGIAAFRRGHSALIVLDQSRTIDTSSFQDDPVFAAASVQTLPTATIIRLPLDPSAALAPTRTADAWRLTVVPREPNPRPIQPTVIDERIALPASAPGTVIGVVDPDTGATLLVGTQRRDGQAVPVQRRSAEFTLLSTWIGVAVEPAADLVTLRPTPQGFVLDGTPAGLAVSPPSDLADQLARAAGLTRQFDFPSQPTAIAMQRLRRQMGEDAATPPLARAPRRREVARTMISLGLGAEAASMLRLAAADDPHEAAAADNAALSSIAALLAHRPNEADGLADPRLEAADDIVLWRAVRLAQLQEGSAQAAAMFAATLPLILAYPAQMLDRLLPLAAETMVAGGEMATAAALFAARKDDAALDLGRGMLLEEQNDVAGALATYDRLVRSHDQSVHARAGVRAVELRLASGSIDVRQAADRLEPLLYAWRGDRHERTLRERLAELKARNGAWRSALALLRETETLFPEEKAAIHAHLADTFAGLLRDNTADSLPALELVSVAEENADLLPAGPDGDALQAQLADRLLALDLPKRAGPVLEKLMQGGNSAVARAGFGARLATLRLREGDAIGTLAALDASTAPDLPAELVEKRTLLAATANARRGDGERALAALGSLDTAAAVEARATILERNNDWPAAQQALSDFAARTVPADGKLDDTHRRTLLRLATAAARAGNDTVLSGLRQRDAPRMGSGPLADMFRLLTAEQVRSSADLKRSNQEAALARALPGQLKSILAPARQTQ